MITGLLQKRKKILTGNKLEERRSFQSTVQGDYVGMMTRRRVETGTMKSVSDKMIQPGGLPDEDRESGRGEEGEGSDK